MKILGQDGLIFIANKYKELKELLLNKVDRVEGKDLSSNDYTDLDKKKLDKTKTQVVISEQRFFALSSDQQNDDSIIYFISE